ncbi:MAG: TolC family protein, partial [Candidatus Eremiobacterota bacterium]
MRFPPLALGVWLCVLLALPVQANQELTLAEALALAQQQNPELAAASTEPKAALGDLTQADTAPNPVLGVETAVEGGTGVLDAVGLSYTQEWELGGKRDARIALAEARLEQARLVQQDALRLLRLQVKEAFAELLYAQAAVEIRAQAVELTRQALELTRKRLALGDVAGLDVIQLESELARREATLAEARGRLQSARVNLALKLGDPTMSELQAHGELGRAVALPELAPLRQASL